MERRLTDREVTLCHYIGHTCKDLLKSRKIFGDAESLNTQPAKAVFHQTKIEQLLFPMTVHFLTETF